MEGILVHPNYRNDVHTLVKGLEKDITELLGFQVDVMLKIKPTEITSTVLQAVICKELGVLWSDVISKSRKRELSHARRLYSYFSREILMKPLKVIAADLNYYDHSDAIHAMNTLKDLLDTNYEPLTTWFKNIQRTLFKQDEKVQN